MSTDSSEVPVQTSQEPPWNLRLAGLILTMALAGFAGAWLASLGAYLYDLNQQPEALRDGQYAFRFLESIPPGWITAVLICAAATSIRPTYPRLHVASAALLFLISTPLVTLPLLLPVSLSLGLVIQLFQLIQGP